MELMQMAGHLSLEFDAYVTGPHTAHQRSQYSESGQLVQIIAKNGHGVAVTMFDKPVHPLGTVNVWGIAETGRTADGEPELPVTQWGERSELFPSGTENGVTFDRIRDLIREVSALPPLPHRGGSVARTEELTAE